MSDKMKNLVVRTLSGVMLAVVVFGAIFLGPRSFGLLMWVIMAGGLLEFYRMSRTAGLNPQRHMAIIAATVLLIANYWTVQNQLVNGGFIDAKIVVLLLLAAFVSVPVMLVVELWRKNANPIADLGATMLGLLYVALPMSMLLYVPLLADADGVWNPWVMTFYILLIWANDVFAYLVGMSCGRHRLFERISPKKSWEGFFGGIAGALAIGWVAATVLEGSLLLWIGLALVIAVSGVLGDLVESMFKRAVGVKDSGAILPGHGGWLDRFDALIISAPFAFAYLLVMRMFGF